MRNIYRYANLLNEEKRTTVWFLWLFYIIFFGYEIINNFMLPQIPWGRLPEQQNFLDGVLYIAIISLLPIAIFLLKKDRPTNVKYIIFCTYTILNLLSELIYYLSTDNIYASGNIVEIVIIIFSPIFVNKRFFYLVILGTISKFVVVGLILNDSVVYLPIVILILLSIVAFIILNRFLGYVEAFKETYDKQLEGIVKGVIATLELKDPYTRGHSERVAEYANILAKATKSLNSSDTKYFYFACLLHDIGKIHIPDSILTKPGRLTKAEFDTIKEHPSVGAQAVKQVEGISEYIAVIEQHHERWDGNGYPYGLQGEAIDYLARITSIADAFDAMTSSRSYRDAMPLEKAYQNIIEGSGTQFDPNLVEIFKDVYPDWVRYHTSYQDLT
ncbi:HD-GYP domain-containing protein [Gracilibacillus caseinilyticus]|uniref:HD-GYP domain-containing protein n=1 Tax=Gracilibacillus caseinilyticus TaxID=2932256 RepID=A0ABY4ERL9_9BACI|nr:HD-GYP domain-containing protein [Gracilibacillus caseinilyticus]UOQ46995.1 HD-GYP domain-containing protein [Gracilibacillus caseinilyticus]